MDNNSGYTYLLKFGDMGVPQGSSTIKEHCKILDKYEGNDKYVWWACWKKQREKFDKDFYNGFKSALSEKTKSIILYNSYKQIYFSAECSDINFISVAADSPNPEHTPAYYNKKEYSLWFKLINIKEICGEKLNLFTPEGVKLTNGLLTGDSNKTIWIVKNF